MPEDHLDITDESQRPETQHHDQQFQQVPTHIPPHQYHYAPYTHGHHYFGPNMPNMFPPGYIPGRPMYHPGSIRRCVNSFTYIWFNDGRNFWAYISNITRNTIYGFRWTGIQWVYFEADINDIEIFACG